jgi:putative ABC transport system permease protein
MMWSFAWKNLISRPSRTALAVLGLTIPVLAFLGLFSISGGIRHLMGDTLAGLNDLMVLRETALAPVWSELPPGTGDALRKVPGLRVIATEVWKVSPPIDGRGNGTLGSAFGLLTRPKDQGLNNLINLIAVEGQDIPEHRKLKHATIADAILPASKGGGRMVDETDIGKPHVAISTKIARKYPGPDGSPKKVGQTIRLGTKEFTIVGIFSTGSLVIDGTIVMDIGEARKLFALPPDAVSAYVVEPTSDAETDAVVERIERTVPEVKAQRISQFNVTLGAIMGRLDQFLLMAVGLAMLVGGVGIANTMLMSTSERFVEFGVMRTNGWTRRNVLALVTTESALLGIVSGLIGSGLATAVVVAVNRFLDGFSLDLSPALIALSVAGALLIATLSGLYPAWKASRMTPMDAIRHSGI